MKIYVLGENKDTDEFLKMVKNLKCTATREELLRNGFTNFDPPHLCYFKNISLNDRYPVVFGITISSKTLRILHIEIIDDNFGQPHFVNKDYNEKIREIISDFKIKNLIADSK